MTQRRYFAKSLVFITLIGLSILTFALFVILNVFGKTNVTIKEDILQQAKDKLSIAFLLVNQHYESYINGVFDETKAQEMSKNHLENLFYGPENLDYFWVLSKDGILIAHPYLKKDYIDKHYTEVDDPVFQKAVVAILQAAKENRSYVEYEFYKYQSKELEKKVSAIKVFEPWGWIVGTGYYKSTLLAKIKAIQSSFTTATAVFFGLIAVLYIAFLIQYRSANRQISKLLQQTREEADRLRTLIETIPQPVALFDKDCKLLDFNRAYSDIQNFEQMGPEIHCCSDVETFEVQLKTSSGLRYYSVRCVPVLNHRNEKEGSIHLYNDITTEKLQIIFWQDMARQDPLTKVANRHTLEELMDSFSQLGREFSVIMMDIDGFKMINDTYGHLIGDRVLSYFAQVVKNSIRKDVFFIRYGGDEFLLIMPNASAEIADNLIERIRQSFEKPLEIDETEIKIAFCAGIATFPKDGRNLRELIDRADKALYAAKLSGKNSTGY
ncbi:MAG: diguanylate cyclase [Pseudothermotoga sp.]